jgi:AcrR family transcriptional regulator
VASSARGNGHLGASAASSLDPRARARDQEVLEVGAEVFARKGYSAATVQDVADALGILKGSLYYYIRTKEDLLFGVMVEVHEAADELHAKVAAAELSAFEQLLLYVRLQIEWNLRNLVKVSVYYNDMRQLSAERFADVRRRSQAHEAFVVDLLAQGQKAGDVVGTTEAALLANQVLAVVIWPHRWYRPRGGVSVDGLAGTCEEFVRSALTAPARSQQNHQTVG